MNVAHLETFLWLRWRLAVNQFRHSGPGGAIVSGLLAIGVIGGALIALILGLFVGLVALRTASSNVVMIVWDVHIAGFVFFWLAGLAAELQRADSISLDRFLHLPVSPSSAFAINFLGSSISFALVLMLPAMTGLALGLVLSRGVGMLVLFPLIAAFFLMMSALAYQFRGWLASLMQNPRRRRMIVAVVPLAFVLTAQLPNLWNNVRPGAQERRDARAERRRLITRLNEDLAAGRITREEYANRVPVLAPRTDDYRDTVRLVNTIVPPGWLAYGAESAANGRLWPAFAGVLGMAFIATVSLRRAYGTTLRLYKGDFDRKRRQHAAPAVTVSSAPGVPTAHRTLLMERRLPWTSERVSAIAMAAFRSWSRATEMKMALLTPLFMTVVFSGMFAAGGPASELGRPLRTTALAGFVLILGMIGPIGNQFAYDRAGFRTFVLSPVPRRDMLVGRNLAAMPFAFAIMGLIVGLSQWFRPMRLDHLIGVVLQLVSMYLAFCLLGNAWSIVSPVALKPGSGMPVPNQGMRNFGHIALMLLSPLTLTLTLIPLGAEALFSYMNWFPGLPAYVVLGGFQLVVIVLLYRRIVDWEGGLLQRREQRILEIVGSKSE
jgi:ABC-2 type transport system permease protein